MKVNLLLSFTYNDLFVVLLYELQVSLDYYSKHYLHFLHITILTQSVFEFIASR